MAENKNLVRIVVVQKSGEGPPKFKSTKLRLVLELLGATVLQTESLILFKNILVLLAVSLDFKKWKYNLLRSYQPRCMWRSPVPLILVSP